MRKSDSGQSTPGAKAGKKSRHEKNVMTAAKGGGITFAGRLFQNFMALVFAAMLARMMGAGQYGVYKLIVIITAFAAAISLVGLEGGIKRFIALSRKSEGDNMLWGVIQIGIALPFAVTMALCAIIAIAAEPIALRIFDEPALATPLRLASLAIPFITLGHSLAAIVVGFKRVEFDMYARGVAFHTIKLSLAFIALMLGFGLSGVVAAYIVAAIFTALLLLFYVHRLFSLTRPIHSAERRTREIMRFSLPLFFSLMLNQFGRRFETLMLGAFSVMANVGVYSAILSISDIGNLGYTALRYISSPIFAELHTENRIDELKKVYQVISKWAFTFNLPFFLIILIFPENLLLIFGKEFTVGAAGMIILAGGTLINASTGASGALINMAGYSKVTFYNSLSYLLVTLVLDFLLIPKYGLIGAAWAGALTLVIINLVRVVEVYVLVNHLLPINRGFLKPLTAGIVVAVLIYFLKSFVLIHYPIVQFIVLLSTMLAVYIGLIWLFKLSPEDQMIVDKALKNRQKKEAKKQRKRNKGNTT